MPDLSAEVFTYGLNELEDAARWVRKAASPHLLWCFEGEIGAGKTTLIKEICKQLGVISDVSSPTFSLVNEYQTGNGEKIFHFDFYRIRSIEEVYDIGYETYFDSGSICLIEWPEKISVLLDIEDKVNFVISIRNTERSIHKISL